MDQTGKTIQLSETEQPAGKPVMRYKNEWVEWIKTLSYAIFIVVAVRWLFFTPFIVDGPSMEPNFWTGERLIVNKILYNFKSPQAGEVVVFQLPDENRNLIKRVIAVAGDTIEYRGDKLHVNGKKVEEGYIQVAIQEAHQNGLAYNIRNFPNNRIKENKVPAGHIFVMGDNRSNSTDSRMLGFIPLTDIIGRADIIFWPASHAKLIQHH